MKFEYRLFLMMAVLSTLVRPVLADNCAAARSSRDRLKSVCETYSGVTPYVILGTGLAGAAVFPPWGGIAGLSGLILAPAGKLACDMYEDSEKSLYDCLALDFQYQASQNAALNAQAVALRTQEEAGLFGNAFAQVESRIKQIHDQKINEIVQRYFEDDTQDLEDPTVQRRMRAEIEAVERKFGKKE